MKLGSFLLASILALVVIGTNSSSSFNSIQQFSEAELLAHGAFKKLVGFAEDALQDQHEDTLFVEREHNISHTQRWSTVNKFVFTNCAQPTEEQVVVNSVKVKPDPLKLPGNVTAGGSVTIKAPFGSPLKMALEIYYKVLGVWIKVPCFDNVGSCTYADFCKMINVKKCPPAIVKAGLKCQCPFPSGNFSVPSATLAINAKVPVSGDIKVKAEATMNGKLLTCAQLQLSIA